jgi:hypothetical protein
MLTFYKRDLYSRFQTMNKIFYLIKDATKGSFSNEEISEVVKIHRNLIKLKF